MAARKPVKKVARRSSQRRTTAKGGARPRRASPAPSKRTSGPAFRSADPQPPPPPRAIDSEGSRGDAQSQDPSPHEAYGS